jgi:hypothetical protein
MTRRKSEGTRPRARRKAKQDFKLALAGDTFRI